MAQLMKLSRSFFLFLDSVRKGDAIAIEHTVIDWMPRFRATGKHRYVDLVMRMIETNYGTLSPYELEEQERTEVIGGSPTRTGEARNVRTIFSS
mmetsp:Transcript_23650/g.43706  ORF Transcript_23650/g.43706 Transcript_23650/m.43706 type:complete len:94 (-) Transcript_23650:84-365(-)